MSKVSSVKKKFFYNVGVMRNSFPLARHFFDIHVDVDGITGYFMWSRNQFRFPVIHNFLDFISRRSRENQERLNVVQNNEKNFFVPFSEIQGCVIDSKHKEIQLLSSKEKVNFYFRPQEEYESFIKSLQDNTTEKVFSRDNVEIQDSVYVS